MSVAAALEASVAKGTIPSLDELGGVEAILSEQVAVIASPFLDVLVESIARGSEDQQTALVDLVISGFREAEKPTVFRDAANALLAQPGLREMARPRLIETLAQRVEGRGGGGDALTAAYALEALFRFGLEDRRAKLKTLLLLEGVSTDDDGLFAQHAARIVGVACHQWADPDLQKVLVRLQANGEAEDEAAFELAMVAFAEALDAGSAVEINQRMGDARELFASVMRRDDGRLEAAVHLEVINIVLSFSDDAAEGLSVHIDNLGRLLAERHDQLRIGETPDWLKPRVDQEIEWWALLRLLQSVDADIRRESWLDAGKVMEQVLAVYGAERTVTVGGAFHTLVAPRIEASFVRRQGLCTHLHDLLADEDWAPPERSIAEALRKRVSRRAAEGFPARLDEEGCVFPELGAALQDRTLLSQVPEEMARKLEILLADRVRSRQVVLRRDVQKICYAVTDGLAHAQDYRGVTRIKFDELVQQVVAFCDDRQNADLSQLGARGRYLRIIDAVENELQQDLREWLRGNMPAVTILPEVPGMAAGRSDLYVDFGDASFVVELKRHHGFVDRDVARTYRAQAVAYQATGPKLGMLGMLELVDRPGPPASLEECIWIDSYVPEGSTLVRHLVVFRVPGMLKPPSQMK